MKNRPSSENRGSAILFALVALAILGLIGAYFYFVVYKLNVPSIGNLPGLPSINVKLPRYFINCDDTRQVIEENGLLYTACGGGGVLVVDKASGEVKDQIGMPDGLSNVFATSIVKKGDKLYVGSQDGFTIFDLKTRNAQKISVGEGLANGANVKLFEDGDNIWVITFDGLTLFNTKTGELTTYKRDTLDTGARKVNLVDALIGDKYVYFLEVASVESSGAVIRYTRADKTFKAFKPDAFGETDQYARIDFNRIGRYKNFVFVTEGSKVFMTDETGDGSWKQITSIADFINKDSGQQFNAVSVLQNTDSKGILLFSSNKIYRYIPSSDTTEIVYNFGKNNASIFEKNEGNIVWFKPYATPPIWASKLDLGTLKTSDYNLKDRPINLGGLVALIDNDAIIQTVSGIYKYSLSENKFTRILGTNPFFNLSFTGSSFEPLPETSDIFIIAQGCGQGCDKPEIQIYNYSDGSSTPVSIPENVLSLISRSVLGGTSYDMLEIKWRDLASGDLGMSVQASGVLKQVVYNFRSKSWRIIDQIPVGADNFDLMTGVTCNKSYSYASNGNKFGTDGCTGRAENDSFSWTMKEGKITEVNKASKTSKLLNPPALEADYTPFDTVGLPTFGPMMYAGDKLWIFSNRGLIAYNPKDGTYKVYGPKDGLVGPQINSVILGKTLWVTTAGLSILQP